MVSEVKVTQSCLPLCNPMDYLASGILQTRILEWVAFPFSRGIFPTHGLNPDLLHCRWILYKLRNKYLLRLWQRHTSRSESGGGEGLLFLRPRPRDFPSEPRRNRSESESLIGVDGLWIVPYSVEIQEGFSSLVVSPWCQD